MRLLSVLFALLPLAAMAEVPQVVTDIPPVQALVAQVMGDLGQPVLLLEKGADEHDFQLRPSQMQAVAEAGLVVWVGPELTPWLDRAMAAAGGVSLPLLPISPDLREFDGGGRDPHAWMDPTNATAWVDAIAAELGRTDPANAATYATNATAAKARIAAMDADLALQLAPLHDRPFVTFHAAYGYFTAHYGLTKAASLALGDAASPGAARLAALQGQMQAGDFDCAFPEVQHDPALLAQVMAGSPVKLGAPLDPVGSSLPFGPNAYDALMRGIAGAMLDCLSR